MITGADFKRIVPLSLYGLSFTWSPMYGTSEATVFSSLLGLSESMTFSRVAGLIALALGMLVFFFAGEKLKPYLQNGPLMPASLIAGVGGMLFGGLVGLGVLPPEFLYLGAFLRGLFMAVITVAWLEVLIHTSDETIGVVIALSLVVYAAYGLVIVFAAKIASIVALVLLMACPVLSYFGYSLGRKQNEGLPIAEQESASAPLHSRILLYVANFLFGVMLGAILHYFAMADTPLFVAAFLVTSIAAVAAFALASGKFNLHEVYRGFMMLFALAVPMLILAGFLDGEVAIVAASAALSIIILYTIVIFTDTQARFRKPFWRIPSLCQVFAAAGMAASSLALEFALSVSEVQPSSLVLLTATCVIFVASAFSPNQRLKTRPWGFSSFIPAESPELHRLRRCGELANSHKLTTRELEILQQLAEGFTKDDIAQTLVISPSTAKTHIRNIYAKLDIHSQKELISLVESD